MFWALMATENVPGFENDANALLKAVAGAEAALWAPASPSWTVQVLGSMRHSMRALPISPLYPRHLCRLGGQGAAFPFQNLSSPETHVDGVSSRAEGMVMCPVLQKGSNPVRNRNQTSSSWAPVLLLNF